MENMHVYSNSREARAALVELYKVLFAVER